VGLKSNGTHLLLAYAADVNILEENRDTIKKNKETLTEASKECGLELNVVETVYMSLSCRQNADLLKMWQFKYLEQTVTNQNLTPEEIKKRLNSGNACYHSVHIKLSSRLLPINLIITYNITILPVVLYGCGTESLALSEKHRLWVFENRGLRRIFSPKRDEVTEEWWELHNGELRNLYSSPRLIRMFKSKRRRGAGHAARMGREGINVGYWWESSKERGL
jgi:hypothetical protein